MTKFQVCLQELQKLAYGPAGMGKVLNRFKQMQIKNPLTDAYMGGVGGPKGLKAALAPARSLGVPEEALEAAIPSLKDQLSLLRPTGPTTLAPVRGDASRFFKRMGADEANPAAFAQIAKSPSNRKAFDAVIKGHEVAETQVKPTSTFMGLGHRSPDVLLREHNMIQTLPKENAPVRDLMKSLREAGGESPALLEGAGFRFGEGPRVSRHARRRLVEMYDKESLRQSRAAGVIP